MEEHFEERNKQTSKNYYIVFIVEYVKKLMITILETSLVHFNKKCFSIEKFKPIKESELEISCDFCKTIVTNRKFINHRSTKKHL